MKILIAGSAGLVIFAGLLSIHAQDPPAENELPVSDPSCTFFGPRHDEFVPALRNRGSLSRLTEDVVAKLATPTIYAATASLIPSAPGGSRTDALQNPAGNLIDKHIFQKIAEEGIAAAPPTTDFEFARRVTLDLTGRIPTVDRLAAFAADGASDKRSKLVEELLASPQWVDKWTMFFGDLYENNSVNDLGAFRYISGVVAFNNFVRGSLQSGKPYDQMVREMIAATGTNSYEQGELNFLVAGVMGGGPIQDVFDKQAAVISEKFLGIAHLDCLLCHNGRGHLDSLSLWGYFATRQQAWGMASFLSHTGTLRIPVPTNQNQNYWAIQNDLPANTAVNGVINRTDYTRDYRLNTQTGNRPERGATNSQVRVAPAYMFTNGTPLPGEPYRVALGRMLTSDFQFARATVNYLWEYFFGIGLVTPSNQFDPARLDPDNAPSDCPDEKNPCTLQASHPRLLNELAQRFIESGYDLKSIMRLMVNSRAYQLSSRYEGEWNPSHERLFARKLVRRLWAEEAADAIVQASGVPITYTGGNNSPWSQVNWAMQLPEPLNTGNQAANFLNALLRGNRDDSKRSGDGAISLALAYMNDPFVTSRLATNNNSLLARTLPMPNDQLVTYLYFAVLSRYPTSNEMSVALTNLNQPNATLRSQEAQNLLWSLFNKVEFIFNY